jgi:hypothetical protein
MYLVHELGPVVIIDNPAIAVWFPDRVNLDFVNARFGDVRNGTKRRTLAIFPLFFQGDNSWESLLLGSGTCF